LAGARRRGAAAHPSMGDEEDEDPMAHLNAMRERMAAMAQMAEISNMQAALAHKVQASMNRIDSMMEDSAPSATSTAPPLDGATDDADAWRRKIALLSAPTDYSSGSTEVRWAEANLTSTTTAPAEPLAGEEPSVDPVEDPPRSGQGDHNYLPESVDTASTGRIDRDDRPFIPLPSLARGSLAQPVGKGLTEETEAWRQKVATLSTAPVSGMAAGTAATRVELSREPPPPDVQAQMERIKIAAAQQATQPGASVRAARHATCPTFLLAPTEPLGGSKPQAASTTGPGLAPASTPNVRVSSTNVSKVKATSRKELDAEVDVWRKRIEELSQPSQPLQSTRKGRGKKGCASPGSPSQKSRHANELSEEAAGSTESAGLMYRLACCWACPLRHAEYAAVQAPDVMPEELPAEAAAGAEEVTRL